VKRRALREILRPAHNDTTEAPDHNMRTCAVIQFCSSRLARKNSATARDLAIDEVSTIIDCQFFLTRYWPLAYDHNRDEDSEERQQRCHSCVWLMSRGMADCAWRISAPRCAGAASFLLVNQPYAGDRFKGRLRASFPSLLYRD